MTAYEGLAEIYDLLMDDVDYEGWVDFYLQMFARAGISPKRVCDCACGTGALSLRLARRGLNVVGIDLSEAMLSRAQASARSHGVRAMFVRQDIQSFCLPRPVEAVICACDGVNYLTDDAALRGFFQSAYAALKPGGGLFFDISSAWKLQNILGNGFFGEDREDVAYLWSNRYDDADETVTMELTFFVRERGDLFRRFEEVHVQKAHRVNHITALLRDVGFVGIEVFGEGRLEAPKAHEQRIHFMAVRPRAQGEI